MTLRDHCDKTVNKSAGNQQGTSLAIKQLTKMVSCKLVVILWIACSTTCKYQWNHLLPMFNGFTSLNQMFILLFYFSGVQAYVDDDGLRNWLESGDEYDPNRRNFEDDPWAGDRRAHRRPPYGFDPNLDNHQEFHQPRFPVHPTQEDYQDIHQPEVYTEFHPRYPVYPPRKNYPDLHQPELHPKYQGVKPQLEDLSNLFQPMVHPEPHPKVPEVINPPRKNHSDLHEPELHPEPHPGVPEVIDRQQEDHPDLYQPELDHPVPLAPYPVSAPNSDHLPTEAQPVTPVSNDSPHSAQTPEESSKTEESSSTFSTEPLTLSTSEDYSTEWTTQTEDNYLESEPLVEPPTDSKSEKSSMEMMQIPLIVGIVLGAMISLVILSTVVYVFCRSAKARGEYAVAMNDLPKKNKEISEV